MTHIAIQEKLDGKVVDWLEQVSDEQYRAAEQKTTPTPLAPIQCKSCCCRSHRRQM